MIENACADPEAPCPLPFALGDDPPLEPVKATTVEAGFSYATGNLALEGSIYHMNVHDDIFLTPFGEEEPEGGTIDGFFVNGSAKLVGFISREFRRIQSGYVYHYAFVMIVGVFGLLYWWGVR